MISSNKLIKELVYCEKAKAAIKPLIPLLDELNHAPYHKIRKIRRSLNDYASTLSNRRKPIVYTAIYIVKQIQRTKNAQQVERDTNHVISDHAFCQALRRFYSVDLDALKDRVLEDYGQDRVAVKRRGKIVTFLPEGA